MNGVAIERARDARSVNPDSTHRHYILCRVVDALLREDVRECVSRSVLLRGPALPVTVQAQSPSAACWLRVSHFGDGHLWIPVVAADFMQTWRCAPRPLLWQAGEKLATLTTVAHVLARFAHGLAPAAADAYSAFAEECETATRHREISEATRERWFAELQGVQRAASGLHLRDWHARLLHYDRLGAFLDHPFYPTARAKLGFDRDALRAYGPESQRPFLLRWVAVPHALHYPSPADGTGRPPLWPGFETVGLPAALAATHALVPVHPFVWTAHLNTFIREAELRDVVRAPHACLAVAPTLSVRTVVLLDAPDWHLKLPLTIRTLGAKNIRTIKPSTIHDGHCVQTLLARIAEAEPAISKRLLLTREDWGAHVDNRSFLGYILRRYPADALETSATIPVAALLALTPAGCTVAEEAAAHFYDGNLEAFFDEYLELTLRIHLLLWLRYGVALESNQQNSMVVLSKESPHLRLLLKDNDSARIHIAGLKRRWPDLASHVADLRDPRISVDDALPLAQMFTTITLQLNIAVLVEGLADILGVPAATLHSRVRRHIEAVLHDLAAAGEDTALAGETLLESDWLYIKYLLVAATLAEKAETGATDVNKFYGRSAPNFLKSQ